MGRREATDWRVAGGRRQGAYLNKPRLPFKMSRMAQQPDWGKSGAIAGWCAIAVVIIITALAYIVVSSNAFAVNCRVGVE
jgi:hypothetical protein